MDNFIVVVATPLFIKGGTTALKVKPVQSAVQR